jgi:predicted MFS family arabinose efflux permease
MTRSKAKVTHLREDGLSKEHSGVNARSAILSAAYLSAISMLVMNVQPIVLGALADGYHLNSGALGQVGAVSVGFSSLSALTAPLWIRRVDWRTFSSFAVLLATVLFAFGAWTSQAAGLLFVFGLIGLATGGVGAPVFASLGDTANPERNFAIAIVAQSVVAAASQLLLSSYVLPNFGVRGMFVSLSLLTATGLVASRLMARRGAVSNAPIEAKADDGTGASMLSAAALPALLGLLALCVFTAGVLGFWYFVERIGAARGMSHDAIGLALALASLANVASSSLAAWLGGRTPSRYLVAAGSFILLTAFAILQIKGDAAFLISNLFFSFGFGLAQPAYFAVVRKVDATNRLFVAAGGVVGGAGVAIGLLAGPVIERGGYNAMIALGAAFVVTGALLLGLSCLVMPRESAETLP